MSGAWKWPDIDRVIDCIGEVETGGVPEAERDTAVGDQGRALGRYQIQPVCVDDVNRIMGRKIYVNADRSDPVKARDICGIYLRSWGARLPARYKADPDRFAVALARIWNGGPTGHLKEATEGYARKFAEHWMKGSQA